MSPSTDVAIFFAIFSMTGLAWRPPITGPSRRVCCRGLRQARGRLQNTALNLAASSRHYHGMAQVSNRLNMAPMQTIWVVLNHRRGRYLFLARESKPRLQPGTVAA